MTLSARYLHPGDEHIVDDFLEPHTPFAFFMRSNMRKAGLRFEGKAYQADYLGVFEADVLKGILAHAWIGSVQIFAEKPEFIPALARFWRDCLAENPREIECFLGPAADVNALLASLGIGPSLLNERGIEEGLFSLPLDKIIIPSLLEKPGILVRGAAQDDEDLLTDWRHDFNVEAMGAKPGRKTHDKARAEISRRISEGDLFILEDSGQKVSFCGVGGYLSDWRCVGPVWTPPEKRSEGYGRAVTAGALLAIRGQGVANAVLFAHKPDAVKAYRAIGFDRIGDWHLGILKDPVSRL